MKLSFDLRIKSIALSLLLIALTTISCEKDEPQIVGTTEHFQIHSAIVKDDYDISIYIPPASDSNTNSRQLIIGLDGDFHFREITGFISGEIQNGTIPPCIYVGVGNSKNRNRDYTPTAFKHGAGGAQDFYQFLIDELTPELQSRYNIDPKSTKTLMGNSFGGLFTHFAMFQDRASNPFDQFISVGCSYWFDSGVIFEYEQKYAKTHTDLPVKFFNAMGTLEGGVSLASFEEMNERLENRGYSGFESEATLINKHGHSGAAMVGFKKGLRYVFSH